VEGTLVDLLKAAATKELVLKISKWNGIDYGHNWLVLSETKIVLSEEDERERCRRLEDYYRDHKPGKVQDAQANLDKYKGRREVLQTKHLKKYEETQPLLLLDHHCWYCLVLRRTKRKAVLFSSQRTECREMYCEPAPFNTNATAVLPQLPFASGKMPFAAPPGTNYQECQSVHFSCYESLAYKELPVELCWSHADSTRTPATVKGRCRKD
jgi:hypothetical protein